MVVGGQRHVPAASTPGKTPYPLYRRLSGSQGRSGQVRKILPPTGIRSPDRPARSQSLYRLSYRPPHTHTHTHTHTYIYIYIYISLHCSIDTIGAELRDVRDENLLLICVQEGLKPALTQHSRGGAHPGGHFPRATKFCKVKVKVKVKSNLGKATKAQKARKGTTLLFL